MEQTEMFPQREKTPSERHGRRIFDRAFPTSNSTYPGITKRQYFAARAMQSLILEGNRLCCEIAVEAYRIADCMVSFGEHDGEVYHDLV